MSTAFFNKKNTSEQHEFLVDFLSGALYGNYWATADLDDDTYNTFNHKNDCIEDVWARALMGGCDLTITDVEEDEQHDIELEDILEGLDQLQLEHPKVWARIVEEDGSADMLDYDAALQYAVFKEWIYG